MNDRTIRVLEFEKIKEMLIKKAESNLGKELASKVNPSTDMEAIATWQKETHEATSIILQRGNPPLGGIKDIKYYMKRAEIGSYLYPGQLLEVSDTLRVTRRLKSFMKDVKEEQYRYPMIQGFINSLYTFKNIEDRIETCIISEDEISDNASTTLKHIRREITNKNASVKTKLNSMISSTQHQKYLQDAIVTIRQDRYVIPVKQEYRGNIPGLIHDQSSSGATLFVEPMAIVELNNELKELKLKEQIEIERILRELTELVAEKSKEIISNQKILEKLDFIFAKGKLAVEMNAVEPKMNRDGYIRIKNGRHPLLDKKTVVPTNIWLGDEFKTLVVTGPNTGGKTVTLKTVGLFTLMAQTGLHVPADHGTKLAVFEQVFADIGDEQSIEQSLSTFSGHMTNIVQILDSIKENALVLLDELGAGTDPTEGAALAIAILEHLYSLGIRTIATTHYTELKQFALTKDGVQNASVEFNIETLSPTYKLLIGVPGKSNAFEISKKLGLSEYIVEKSRKLISGEGIAFEEILETMERDRKAAEEERDDAIRLKLIIQKQKQEYESKHEKLAIQKEKILREAKEEARKLLRGAKDEADRIIKELRTLSQEQEEKLKNKKIEEARSSLRSKLGEVADTLSINPVVTNSNPPKKLKSGDSVIILTLNQKATVISKPASNGDVLVQAGIMKINVNINNLRLDQDEKKEHKNTGVGRLVKSKAQSVETSIDLRGQMLEEATMNTDKYLDDAYIANLKVVTIIHGKGTGVLREGIKQLLKTHKHVKTFRIGSFNEGGTGATIAELK
ncbi:endonuclease MutS2 [Lutibacter sp. B2]|nr:endonuclease MutS2 [Lutibacter sp. B2]